MTLPCGEVHRFSTHGRIPLCGTWDLQPRPDATIPGTWLLHPRLDAAPWHVPQQGLGSQALPIVARDWALIPAAAVN